MNLGFPDVLDRQMKNKEKRNAAEISARLLFRLE